MDYVKYKEEIELSVAQNGMVELELYSIVAQVIRDYNLKISLRDVSTRRRSDISKKFYRKAGFPDFVILERSTEKHEAMGAIEIKKITDNMKFTKQIKNHISSFGNLIYTNGLKWFFCYNDIDIDNKELTLGEYNKKGNFEWYKEELFDIELKNLIEDFVKNCIRK